jgi:release factor glutamine methyltransferase
MYAAGMPRTLADALSIALTRLAGSGPSVKADAVELVSRLAGITRSEVRLKRERRLSTEDWSRLDQWLVRRLAGEPVQYITGRAAFRNLDLAVGPAVLIPRPETEGLVEAVLETLAREQDRWTAPRVLDLGTGSGAIALALAAEWPSAIVSATDASADALEVARTNAHDLKLEGRVTFLAGDWFDAIPSDEKFEVVVSNPPYIGEQERAELPVDVRDHEPGSALFAGPDGLQSIRLIVDAAPRHLVTHGLLALELSESHAHEVAAWFDGAHDWESVEVRDDLDGRPRVLLARRTAGPAIAPAQWREEG